MWWLAWECEVKDKEDASHSSAVGVGSKAVKFVAVKSKSVCVDILQKTRGHAGTSWYKQEAATAVVDLIFWDLKVPAKCWKAAASAYKRKFFDNDQQQQIMNINASCN